MKSGHLYYASDKAVYDALLQHNFKNADLKEIFLSRGILVSGESERDVIALYFSMLNHDYYDHQRIASIFGVDSRKEKTTLSKIANKFSDAKLDLVAAQLQAVLEETGASVVFEWQNKKMEIKVVYEDYNSNRSEFKQTVQREGVFEIERTSSGISVRYPQNKYITEVKDKLVDLLARHTEAGEAINVSELSLRSVEAAQVRIKFFRDLLSSLDGYELKDVTDIYVYNPKIKDGGSDDMGVHITKASLKGEGVLSSPELDAFFKTGFYISRVVWTAVSFSEQSDVYELEAQFSDPEHCDGFSYAVRGRYKLNGRGYHNKNKTNCDSLPEKKMLRLIEAGAARVHENILAEISE